MTARSRTVVTILGAPDMGKSTLARAFLDRYPDSAGAKIICDPARQWEDSEFPGFEPKALEDWANELHGHGEGPANGGRGPGIVLLDDSDRYIYPASWNVWRHLWLANRHIQLDVIVTAHRPQGVPKDLLEATQELWIFNLEESHAIDYLSTCGPTLKATFRNNADPIPAEKGLALRVIRRERRTELVKVF